MNRCPVTIDMDYKGSLHTLETRMACEILKQKIHDTLRGGYFSDAKDFVDVSDGSADHVHIVIVSRKFNGHTMGDRSDTIRSEREDRIWADIVQVLSEDELEHISRIVAVNPEEIKIYT